ncbi:hypothetical protein PSPO01_07843 [Paraphaeosphaeria sporulosa]
MCFCRLALVRRPVLGKVLRWSRSNSYLRDCLRDWFGVSILSW